MPRLQRVSLENPSVSTRRRLRFPKLHPGTPGFFACKALRDGHTKDPNLGQRPNGHFPAPRCSMQIRAPGSSWDLPAEPRTVSSSPAAPGRPPLAPGRGASGPDALQPPAGRAAAPRRARARSPSPRRTPSLPGPQPLTKRAPLGRPVASPALNSSHRGAPRPPPPPIRNFHGELVSPRRERGRRGGRRGAGAVPPEGVRGVGSALDVGSVGSDRGIEGRASLPGRPGAGRRGVGTQMTSVRG